MIRRRRHRGYVLLLALALTALAAVVVAGLSRVAMQRIVSARIAEAELQRKWGVESCRQTLLPYAEQLIAPLNTDPGRPVSVRVADIQLGDQQFSIRLSDEQAKANVNTLLQLQDEPQAEQSVHKLLSGTGLASKVRLRAEKENDWPIGSFGQMFENVAPADLLAGSPGTAAVDQLTCWGDGTLNVKRASDDVMNEALSPILTRTQIGQLRDLRKNVFISGSNGPPAEFLAPLQLESDLRDTLEKTVDVKSRCYSLWLTVSSDQRNWTVLAVTENLAPDTQRQSLFEW